MKITDENLSAALYEQMEIDAAVNGLQDVGIRINRAVKMGAGGFDIDVSQIGDVESDLNARYHELKTAIHKYTQGED